MAEYYLDKEGQIYADIAYRLGVIVKQYDKYIDGGDPYNFDSTLCLTFLQNLLTINSELFRKGNGYPLTRENQYFNEDTLVASPNYLSLNPEFIIQNTFVKEQFTVINFLTHLRNSLSHPTSVNKESENQSTGYYTLSDQTGKISSYIFIDSPDVKHNRTKTFNNHREFNSYAGGSDKRNHPFTFTEETNKIILGNPRIFKICLTPIQLKKLVLDLSSFLAQPIQKNWNGNDFNPNILDDAA